MMRRRWIGALLMVLCAPAIACESREHIGGDWYAVWPARMPEAGFPPHGLARKRDGEMVVLRSDVQSHHYYEPDCVVFRAHDTLYIACGDRAPVQITTTDVWEWTYEPDGLRMVTPPAFVGDRLTQFVRVYPIRELQRYATGQATGSPEQALVETASAAGVNDRDELGRPPLLEAAYQGNLSSAEALLEAGADPNLGDTTGFTPLMAVAAKVGMAEMDEHMRMLAILLKGGADPDRRNHEGRTALHFATELGNDELVRMLIEAGADTSLPDPRRP